MEKKDLFDWISWVERETERHFYDLLLEVRRGIGFTKWRPPADVFETEKALVIRLELPGTSLEDIRITLSEDKLTVSGVRRDLYEGGERRFYQAEIPFGEFERSFFLPWSIKEEDIRATYKDGILTIILHKPEPKKLKVHVERE